MKIHLKICAALVGILAGCGEPSDGTPETAGTTNTAGNPLTAPVDYLESVSAGRQSAVKRIDVASLTHAIQLFQVEHERYPRDLNELVKEGFIGQIPPAPHGMKITYDATSGEVKVVPQ